MLMANASGKHRHSRQQHITPHAMPAGRCVETGVDNVGTVPAALTAYLAIQAFSPDLVLSVGTAGGFAAKTAAIGDIYISTGTVNHDRRIPIPVRALSDRLQQ